MELLNSVISPFVNPVSHPSLPYIPQAYIPKALLNGTSVSQNLLSGEPNLQHGYLKMVAKAGVI